MANEMYCKIAQTERGLEFHLGHDREAVAGLQSMSKRLRIPENVDADTVPQIYDAIERWVEEIHVHQMKLIP